jgi:bifunctional N-acetylglucosamine-1-phosphate-uridyltransferase/glucosamine-1-phosphate-acetyltransferase GlmU-like protein
MIFLTDYIKCIPFLLSKIENMDPWDITTRIESIIESLFVNLGNEYIIKDNIAVHRSSRIENNAILKGPLIIEENCFVGSYAYLRNGVYLGKNSSVGPSCEIKSSLISGATEIAHLNFIGDSIIGGNVNFEAGSIVANYFNERDDKIISVLHNGNIINSHVEKFGSLIGDGCKIGANAVLSPGTLLPANSIVARLHLVEQIKTLSGKTNR